MEITRDQHLALLRNGSFPKSLWKVSIISSDMGSLLVALFAVIHSSMIMRHLCTQVLIHIGLQWVKITNWRSYIQITILL